MNQAEFNSWYADFCAAFPDTDAFVKRNSKPGDPDAGKATLQHWFGVLEKCELADAMEVTKRIFSGDMPDIERTSTGYADRSTIPRHVRKLCAAMKPFVSESQQQPYRPGRRPTWSAGEVLLRLKDCHMAGGDALAMASQLMPVDREEEPRYRCRECRDYGLLTVWHPDSMRLAAKGELRPGRGCYSQVIRCDCEAGERWDALSRGGYEKAAGRFRRAEPLIYNRNQWRRCYGFGPEDVADLTRFMENYRPANYDESLALFNEREAF